MSITGISSTASMLHAAQTRAPSAQGATPQAPDFAHRLEKAVNDVNAQQSKATEAARAFETGQTDDLAAVMVEQQLASLGFQMTMQVRNKALTAYRDIMNMPV